jgi:hypothetical protein
MPMSCENVSTKNIKYICDAIEAAGVGAMRSLVMFHHMKPRQVLGPELFLGKYDCSRQLARA